MRIRSYGSSERFSEEPGEPADESPENQGEEKGPDPTVGKLLPIRCSVGGKRVRDHGEKSPRDAVNDPDSESEEKSKSTSGIGKFRGREQSDEDTDADISGGETQPQGPKCFSRKNICLGERGEPKEASQDD